MTCHVPLTSSQTLRHDPPRIWQQAAAAQRLRHTAPPGPSVRAASGSPAGGGDADGDACSSWDTTNAALWDTQSELWDAGASSCSGWLLSEAPSATASAGASSSGRPYDAILMLGGGLLPTGALPEWVVRRLEGCLYLYRQQTAAAAGNGASPGGSGDTTSSGSSSSAGNSYTAAGGAAGDSPAPSIVLLGAGTPHKPPVIDEGGWVVHESTAYAAYLLRRGVPAAHLLKEAQVGTLAWGCCCCCWGSPCRLQEPLASALATLDGPDVLCWLPRNQHAFCFAHTVVRHRGQRLLLPPHARPARRLEVRPCNCWRRPAAAAAAAPMPPRPCRRRAARQSYPRPAAPCLRSCSSPTNPPGTCRRIAVVTSEFHMPRTRATFDFVYGLAGRQLYGDEAHFSLDYQPGGRTGRTAVAAGSCWGRGVELLHCCCHRRMQASACHEWHVPGCLPSCRSQRRGHL